MRIKVRSLRPCRRISCAAAKGMRCVKPSSATESPSCTKRATAFSRSNHSMREYRPLARYSHTLLLSSIFAKLCDNRPVLQLEAFEGDPDFVLSLARGLTVIEAFQDRPDGVTVGDVAARTGLSRAAVRRLLITLELLGYASHNGPVYRLSSRALRLGFSFLSSSSLSVLALPILEEISAVIHESSSISVLEGDEIVYLARSATQRVMSVGLSVGSRLPAYCTSMGRVMLAAMS